VLHQQVVLLSMITRNVPYVRDGIEVRELGQGFYRVVCKVGFMQSTDVPKVLASCVDRGIVTDPMTTTYYLGRQTLLTNGEAKLARWRKILFSFLSRNARPPTAFFNLPPNRVVELGLQIEM
jgi:KUP system potassium uptake protein